MERLISVSRMKTFMTCPLKFHLKYNECIPTPSNSFLLLGKAVHSAIASNYKFKLESKENKDLPLDCLLDMYSDSYEEILKSEEVVFNGENRSQLKDEGAVLSKLYHTEVAPKVKPKLVEEHFILSFEAPINYRFQGFLDLVDDKGVIHETKTTRRKFPEDTIENDIQLTGYSILYKHTQGKSATGLQMDILVRNKTPKLQILTAEPRNAWHMNKFLRLLGSLTTAMESGNYWPVINQVTCCHCPYKQECRHW